MATIIEYHTPKADEHPTLDLIAAKIGDIIDERIRELSQDAAPALASKIKFAVKTLGPGGIATDALVQITIVPDSSSEAEPGALKLDKIAVTGAAISSSAFVIEQSLANFVIPAALKTSIGIKVLAAMGIVSAAEFELPFIATYLIEQGLEKVFEEVRATEVINNAIDTLDRTVFWNVEFQKGKSRGGYKYFLDEIPERDEALKLAQAVVADPAKWGLSSVADIEGAHIQVTKTTFPSPTGPMVQDIDGWTFVGDGFYQALEANLQSKDEFLTNGWGKNENLVPTQDKLNSRLIESLSQPISSVSAIVSDKSYLAFLVPDGAGGQKQVIANLQQVNWPGRKAEELSYSGVGAIISLAGDVDLSKFNPVDGGYVFGGAGAQIIQGSSGDDVIYGGAGSDRIIGGDGANILFGDDGDDTLQPGGGPNGVVGAFDPNDPAGVNGRKSFVDGGAGRDTADYSLGPAGNFYVNLTFDRSLFERVAGATNHTGIGFVSNQQHSEAALVNVEIIHGTSDDDKVFINSLDYLKSYGPITFDFGQYPFNASNHNGGADVADFRQSNADFTLNLSAEHGDSYGSIVEAPDALFIGIKDWKLGDSKQTVKIDDSIFPGAVGTGTGLRDNVAIDAGGGEDTVDFSAGSQEIWIRQDGTVDGINLKLNNFEEVVGTQFDDRIEGLLGYKKVDLGAGNDVASNLTGGPVALDMGLGADIVHGSFSPGTTIALGNDHDKDVVRDVVKDVRIDQVGKEDELYAFDGTIRLRGGGRNSVSESQWARALNGLLTYGIDAAGELQVQLANSGVTMYVSNFLSSLSASASTAGILLYEVEAWGGLLLDPNKPKNETMLGAWEAVMGYRWKTEFGWSAWKGVDPLVLDLNGDGISTFQTPNVGINGTGVGVRFDVTGDGFATPTGWIDGYDGFVVRDANGNGKIDSVQEMLGEGLTSGLQALASYDYNNDGKVDAADWRDANGNGARDASEGALDMLRIWRDVNGDAIIDAGELMSFAGAGVESISVAATRRDQVFDAGNQVDDDGSFTRTDGTTGLARDISFAVDPWNSQWRPEAFGGAAEIDARIAAEPQLKGHGALMDLRNAMALDERSADQEVAAAQAKGETIERRETLADIVDRVGPTLNTPLLSELRKNAAPIFEAWARAASEAQQEQPAPRGGSNVLVFVVHHGDGPDETVDYAYEKTVTVTNPDNSTQSVTYWELASGAPVRDANNQIIERPDFQQITAYALRAGGVWQYDDGQHRDIAGPTTRGDVRLFVTQDGGGAQTIVDYAFLATDTATGASYWKLASGEAITDASGAAIALPSYDDLLAFHPQAGGEWKVFDGANPDFKPGGAGGAALTLLISREANGDETVVDFAYETSETVIVDGQETPVSFWRLGSGETVRDNAGNILERPTLAQIEQFETPAGAIWRQLTGARPENSADVAHQGLNIFITIGVDGAETILDYAYAVSETVENPATAITNKLLIGGSAAELPCATRKVTSSIDRHMSKLPATRPPPKAFGAISMERLRIFPPPIISRPSIR